MELPPRNDPQDVLVGEFVVFADLLAVVFRGGTVHASELEALAEASP